jgi:hypothetical protein
MNERIYELAEHAMGTKKHIPPVWQFYDYELEKFAELIIDECCGKLLDMHEKTNGNHNYYKHAAIQIKNHFGAK